MSTQIDSFLKEYEIITQLCATETPQQNGVVEKRNLTLIGMVRSMISSSSLPTPFWGYVLETTIYLIQCLGDCRQVINPICNIFTFGSAQHMLKSKVGKLEARLRTCWFVGYPKGTKTHYFYSQVDQKVFVSICQISKRKLYDE